MLLFMHKQVKNIVAPIKSSWVKMDLVFLNTIILDRFFNNEFYLKYFRVTISLMKRFIIPKNADALPPELRNHASLY